MGTLRPAVLLSAVVLALGGCGGAGPESPPVPPADSPPEPTRLFLAGDGELTVVDVDAGRARVHRLAELAPGDPPYRIIRRGNKLVFYGGDTYVLDPDLGSSPRKLGDSWFFIPSARPDRVWLAILDPASPETVRALAGVHEVSSIDGSVTVPDVRPPGGRWPLAAVGDALVFEDRRGGLEIWDPVSREVTRRFPEAWLGPTHGDLLAWCDRDGRTLHVTNVTTTRDHAVAVPNGFVSFDCRKGAFSPDAISLAVPVAVASGYQADRSLALIDLAAGVASAVDGSRVEAGYVFVAWSSGGDRVFISGGERYKRRQLVEYRLGESRAAPLPINVPDFYGMAAK